jgi:hypothetical protein
VHLGDNAWFIHYHKHMWICPPRKNERNLILCLVLWFRIIQRDYANTLDDGRQLPKPLPFWKPERTRERKSASASASGSGSDTKAIYVRPSDAVRLARVNLARETSEQIRREHEQQRPRAPPIAAGDADVPRSASMDPIRSPSASVQPPLRAPPPAQQLT